MLVFENDGEIDPRLITLMGVNIKEKNNAIGYFGTGLKYAIACLLRWNDRIIIQSGQSEFHFTYEPSRIRDTDINIITMRSKLGSLQLGFTTELGKNWKPWMIYRELWCNMQDEPSARMYETAITMVPQLDKTRVIVDGPSIMQAYAERDKWVLNRDTVPLIHKDDALEIYDTPSNTIFYRGIVVQWNSNASRYLYNILSHVYLTEDRVAPSWATDPIIVQSVASMKNENIIKNVLLAGADDLERRFSYGRENTPSFVWEQAAQDLLENHPIAVNPSVREMYKTIAGVARCPTCNRPLEG